MNAVYSLAHLPATRVHECQWVNGDPGIRGAWSLCGVPCVGAGSWCAEHRFRVFEAARTEKAIPPATRTAA